MLTAARLPAPLRRPVSTEQPYLTALLSFNHWVCLFWRAGDLLYIWHWRNPNWEKLTAVVVKTTTPMIPFYLMTSPNWQKITYCTFDNGSRLKVRTSPGSWESIPACPWIYETYFSVGMSRYQKCFGWYQCQWKSSILNLIAQQKTEDSRLLHTQCANIHTHMHTPPHSHCTNSWKWLTRWQTRVWKYSLKKHCYILTYWAVMTAACISAHQSWCVSLYKSQQPCSCHPMCCYCSPAFFRVGCL